MRRSICRMKVVKLLSAIFLLVPTLSASGATEHRIACPVKLEPQSLQLAHQLPGWTAFVAVGLWLHSAGPMYGPPNLMGVLQENSNTKRGGEKIMKWMWEEKGEPPDSEGKWMACNYGDSNNIILSQRIDDNTSECTVTYTRNADERNDIDIKCKW